MEKGGVSFEVEVLLSVVLDDTVTVFNSNLVLVLFVNRRVNADDMSCVSTVDILNRFVYDTPE